MAWKEEYTDIIVNAFRNPFNNTPELEGRRHGAYLREHTPYAIVNKCIRQIGLYREAGLPYETEEDWNASFDKLGLKLPNCRTKSILERTQWDWETCIRTANREYEEKINQEKERDEENG